MEFTSPESRKSIVILGASGSGKSSVVNAIRKAEFEDKIVIPKRVITLPIREDSNPIENRNVSREVFDEERAKGNISPWWERTFSESEKHMYGFEAVDPEDTRTVVYSANNSMVRSKENVGVQELLRASDIVMVTAGTDECARRISIRTPSMGAEERSARVGDELDFLLLGGNKDVRVIDNEGPLETSQAHFVNFVLERTATL